MSQPKMSLSDALTLLGMNWDESNLLLEKLVIAVAEEKQKTEALKVELEALQAEVLALDMKLASRGMP
jgi:hypothetical protein